MDTRYHIEATVHLDEDDLKGLRTLLNYVRETSQDLYEVSRSLDLGGHAQRVYNELWAITERTS